MSESEGILKQSVVSKCALAVIVPAYGQPSLAAEALRSALMQKTDFPYAIVVVNDGCPQSATHDICLTFAAANPGRVFYLQKKNGGLSAARNTGIEFALGAFPKLEAVYFLDCDNRIGPNLLQRLLDALRSGSENTGWAYPDIDKFGFAEFADMSGAYSPLEHLFRNISEAGSMAARRMLDAGVRFDTKMKKGAEDWEFWLQGLEKGFCGVHVPDTGFRYRKRGESMLVAAERDFAPILDYIRSAHPALFKARAILESEIAAKSRYSIYHPDTNRVSRLTVPFERETLDLDDYLIRLLRAGERPDYGQCPGYLMVMEEGFFEALRERRMLSGVLWVLECALRESTVSAITFAPATTPKPLGPQPLAPQPLVPEPLISWRRVRSGGQSTGSAHAALPIALPCSPCAIALEASQLLSAIEARKGFIGIPSQLGKANDVLHLEMGIATAPTLECNATQALMDLGNALAEKAREQHAALWKSAELDRYRARPSLPRDVYSNVNLPSVFPAAIPGPRGKYAALIVESDAPAVMSAAGMLREQLSGEGYIVHLVAIAERLNVRQGDVQDYHDVVVLPVSQFCEQSAETPTRSYGGSPAVRLHPYDTQAAIATLAAYDVVVSVAGRIAHTLMGSLRHLGVETRCLLQGDAIREGTPFDEINLCAAFEQAYDTILLDSPGTLHLCRAIGLPEKKLRVMSDAAEREAKIENRIRLASENRELLTI